MRTLEPILAKHPFFQGFEPRYMQLITGCASNVRFPAGTTIFMKGSQLRHSILFARGKLPWK
jgi:CRP/FNR family transcriptional regulator, cyclic AMP receptor protein